MSHRKSDLGIPRPRKSAKVVLGLYSVRRVCQGTEQNQTRNTVLMIRSLVLFWGFPNQLSSDSWAVGFEEADHAALWMARRPMGADQRSSARPRRSCGRQCSRQPAV